MHFFSTSKGVVNTFVFVGSVNARRITYKYSIDDNRHMDRGELSLSQSE